ncbi:unnamed protein product [Meganyctiphanes norvegica]|uniref:Uncharacterized protein n=1 Tax=Meganyctiphanes norvegica TaxID=48144 RepID=A0AAV2QQ77_MEGNR
MHYMWLDMNLCRLSPIKGSEVVIGRDGKKMLVKHSGIFVRVNTASPAKMAIKDISQCGSSAIDKTRELGSFDGSSSFKKKKKKKMLNLGLLTVQGNLGLLTVPVALKTMLNLGLLTVLGNLGLLTVPKA